MEAAPKCIGIILDGNRRWGKQQGISGAEAHRAGYEKLKEILNWAGDAGVGTVIAYGFSTENWARPKAEIKHLMKLLKYVLKNELQYLIDRDTALKIIGDRSDFSEEIQKLMKQAEKATAHCKSHVLALALSYGGRSEILQAAKKLAGTKDIESIGEEEFAKLLWTQDMPEPDMIIRPGGQRRLSGFLPWQSTYSELFFTDTFLPALSKKEFAGMLEEFNNRKRNFGS